MPQMMLGIFHHRGDAEDAISEFKDLGYNAKDISIITRNATEGEEIEESTGASVVDGAAAGATTGSVVGGLAGLLVGIGALAIPGVGALLIGGPIAAALGLTGAAATTVSGAVTGALAGGLVGALVGLGLPEEEARHYEESIREGAILIAVPVYEAKHEEAREILEQNGADQIRTIEMDTHHTKRTHHAHL